MKKLTYAPVLEEETKQQITSDNDWKKRFIFFVYQKLDF